MSRRSLILTPISVGIAAGLALAVLQALVRHGAGAEGDELIYEQMAQDPFGTHTFPFGYRVGVPLLVHVSPLGHEVSFTLLALLSTAGAAACLYALMTTLDVPGRLAAAASVAFAISPGILVALLRDGRSVDPATLLVMSAAALLIVKRRLLPLALVLAAGALVRESVLFMIPFAYAVWAQRWIDLNALRRAALVGLPAVTVYVAVRLSIPTIGQEQVVGYNQPFLAARETVISTALENPTRALRRVLLAFGPLWLLAPLALSGMRYARRGLVLVVLCLVALTFAVDWGRVLMLAAPVVIPAACWVLSRRPRLQAPVLAAWVALSLVYAVYMHVYGVEHGLDDAKPPTYPVR